MTRRKHRNSRLWRAAAAVSAPVHATQPRVWTASRSVREPEGERDAAVRSAFARADGRSRGTRRRCSQGATRRWRRRRCRSTGGRSRSSSPTGATRRRAVRAPRSSATSRSPSASATPTSNFGTLVGPSGAVTLEPTTSTAPTASPSLGPPPPHRGPLRRRPPPTRRPTARRALADASGDVVRAGRRRRTSTGSRADARPAADAPRERCSPTSSAAPAATIASSRADSTSGRRSVTAQAPPPRGRRRGRPAQRQADLPAWAVDSLPRYWRRTGSRSRRRPTRASSPCSTRCGSLAVGSRRLPRGWWCGAGPDRRARRRRAPRVKEQADAVTPGAPPPAVASEAIPRRVLSARDALWSRPDADPLWGAAEWFGVPVRCATASRGGRGSRVARLAGALGRPRLTELARVLRARLAWMHRRTLPPAPLFAALRAVARRLRPRGRPRWPSRTPRGCSTTTPASDLAARARSLVGRRPLDAPSSPPAPSSAPHESPSPSPSRSPPPPQAQTAGARAAPARRARRGPSRTRHRRGLHGPLPGRVWRPSRSTACGSPTPTRGWTVFHLRRAAAAHASLEWQYEHARAPGGRGGGCARRRSGALPRASRATASSCRCWRGRMVVAASTYRTGRGADAHRPRGRVDVELRAVTSTPLEATCGWWRQPTSGDPRYQRRPRQRRARRVQRRGLRAAGVQPRQEPRGLALVRPAGQDNRGVAVRVRVVRAGHERGSATGADRFTGGVLWRGCASAAARPFTWAWGADARPTASPWLAEAFVAAEPVGALIVGALPPAGSATCRWTPTGSRPSSPPSGGAWPRGVPGRGRGRPAGAPRRRYRARTGPPRAVSRVVFEGTDMVRMRTTWALMVCAALGCSEVRDLLVPDGDAGADVPCDTRRGGDAGRDSDARCGGDARMRDNDAGRGRGRGAARDQRDPRGRRVGGVLQRGDGRGGPLERCGWPTRERRRRALAGDDLPRGPDARAGRVRAARDQRVGRGRGPPDGVRRRRPEHLLPRELGLRSSRAARPSNASRRRDDRGAGVPARRNTWA